MRSPVIPHRRSAVFPALLVITGIIGWLASFQLLIEKIETLIDPQHVPSCDISPLVSCGPNMNSEQGSVFGFPNPILGVAGFAAPIAVGVALYAGARFARWFWTLFWAGVLAALVFVGWLIGQSIFVLGTLCPYCMVVWAVVIPLFWYLTLFLLKEGILGRGIARAARPLYPWAWLIVLLCYVVITVMAQLRLDVVTSLLYGS